VITARLRRPALSCAACRISPCMLGSNPSLPLHPSPCRQPASYAPALPPFRRRSVAPACPTSALLHDVGGMRAEAAATDASSATPMYTLQALLSSRHCGRPCRASHPRRDNLRQQTMACSPRPTRCLLR
jgi:hypothetical protein